METETKGVTAALAVIRAHTDVVPEMVIVAGSGLSGLAQRVSEPVALPYAAIPGWPVSTVAGHAGELVLGRLGGRPVAVARGRAHLYEGYDVAHTVFGVRVLFRLGAGTLIVTNAAGGLDPDFRPGDLMLIADHVYLPGLTGRNVLTGPNDEALGPRFPVMAGAYDAGLRRVARRRAEAESFRVHEGVYAMVGGPTYETPAEARLLRAAGADAVGMSTAAEVVAARHAGMRVLGISVITNQVAFAADAAAGPEGGELHGEVESVGERVAPRLACAVEAVVAEAAPTT